MTEAERVGTAAIELGGGWAETAEAEYVPRRLPLRAVALVVTAVLAAAPGGSDVRPVRLTEVATATVTATLPDAPITIVGDRVLLPDAAGLTAYGLDDGLRRWRVPLPAVATRLSATDVPGLALMELGDRREWRVIDLADGSTRWRSDRDVLAVGDLAVQRPPSGEEARNWQAAGPMRTTRTIRDLGTGRERWTLRGAAVVVDGAARTGWSIAADGRVLVHDLPDGRQLRSGRLSLPPGRVSQAHLTGGGVLVVTVVRRDGADAEPVFQDAHFDMATLAALDPASPQGNRYDCGAVWCATRPDPEDTSGAGTRGLILDPADGTVLYELPAGVHAQRSSAGLLYVRPTDTADVDGLVDPATGRVLRDLDGWRMPGGQPYPPRFLTREVDGRLQIGRLADGTVRLVAHLPHRVRRCAFTVSAVVCLHDGDRLTFWRLHDQERG